MNEVLMVTNNSVVLLVNEMLTPMIPIFLKCLVDGGALPEVGSVAEAQLQNLLAALFTSSGLVMLMFTTPQSNG